MKIINKRTGRVVDVAKTLKGVGIVVLFVWVGFFSWWLMKIVVELVITKGW